MLLESHHTSGNTETVFNLLILCFLKSRLKDLYLSCTLLKGFAAASHYGHCVEHSEQLSETVSLNHYYTLAVSAGKNCTKYSKLALKGRRCTVMRLKRHLFLIQSRESVFEVLPDVPTPCTHTECWPLH